MTRNILYLLITAFLSVDCLLAQPLELSLNEAISAALKNNPDLLASRFEVDARQAGISQANAVPNPDFVLFVEDFAGSGHFESFDNSQTTAQVNQRIELGGKRGARRNAATLNHDIAETELEIKRREITSSVRKTFFAILLNQQRVRLMQELLNVSKEFFGAVVQKISPFTEPNVGSDAPIIAASSYRTDSNSRVDRFNSISASETTD